MTKLKNLIIVLLLILLATQHVLAQDTEENPYPIAPVQVEYSDDEQITVADCYPLYSGNEDTTLFVYLNLGYDGIAVYACEGLHRGLFTPLPQTREKFAYIQ